MSPPVPDALDFCLLLSRACARLELSMEEQLGISHGLDFADFSLLHWLAGAPDGRIAMADLGQALGIKLSAVARKMIQLEKIGLAQRENDLGGDGIRCARLSAAGKRLVREAEVTARAACMAAMRQIPLDHLPEMEQALVALCQGETSALCRPQVRLQARENSAL